MKKIIKFLMRLIVTIIITILIINLVNVILNLKHGEKDNKSFDRDWNWEKENIVIRKFLEENYPNKYDERYPLLIMKDDKISKKQVGEKRILVIGDSFVYGYGGTNVNYTWWKQLDLRIKEEGYSNVNVYGAGLYGLNTKEELELILKNDRLMELIDPDLVIIGYVTNDPDQYDSLGVSILKEDWEVDKEDHPLYKKNPNLYYEFVDRMNSLDETEVEMLKKMGDYLGYYRYDIKRLMLLENENLEYYKNVLIDVDNRMKELNIPYFYLQTDWTDGLLVDKANEILYSLMDKLSINIYHDLESAENLSLIDEKNYDILWINPTDAHPSIVWTSYCGKYAFEVLSKNYKFLFEDTIKKNIDKFDLKINQTIPSLKTKKIKKNVYQFEYPKNESKRTEDSNFLYFPIEKEYVKLNLEYPKDIKKIVISGKNLKSVELYVNTINEKYGFDLDSAYHKLTLCKKMYNNTFKVNGKITSVNIHATFYSDKDRKIKIEFVE